MNIGVFLSLFILSICSCKSDSTQRLDITYDNYLSSFDTICINHFPKSPVVTNYDITMHTDTSKNDVWLVLSYFNLPDSIYLELANNLLAQKSIAHYNANDSCLLFINPFETLNSINLYTPAAIDTNLIEKICYQGKYPIPNLFNINQDFYFSERNANNWYNIYIIDVNSNFRSGKYFMQPNSQMPIEWKNGYSKGYALCEQSNSIVYWAAIW